MAVEVYTTELNSGTFRQNLTSPSISNYTPKRIRKGLTMNAATQILPGTLDLLILKAVSLGPLHGYGVLLRIGQISKGALLIEQGALYPALFRLVRQGLLKATWGTSENNRKAKYYELTAAGRKRFQQETESWNRLAAAIGTALKAEPEKA
jgi:transcriptional regulator